MDTTTPRTDVRPDVIVILVDDMGFSDFGCTGSEIRTPHIDSIARNGRLLTSMYNSARCCPTRASLLTGMYPHNAGVGQMGANLGTAAYQGFLRDDVMTIAEVMQVNGYRTLMSGKWHVAGDLWATRVDSWRIGAEGHPTPRQRGFDRFYGIVDGVSSFFSPHFMMRDDERIDVSPDQFYMTDAVTDEALAMIDEAGELDTPYFMYLAYTAPHWPLHAHEEDIALYRGVYDSGWDAIRTARHEELNGRGVLENPWAISPRDEKAPAWADVPHKEWEAERMAVYAAMIHRLDVNVGRLLTHLRTKGTLDNTLIIYINGDNGTSAEGTLNGTPNEIAMFNGVDVPSVGASGAIFGLFAAIFMFGRERNLNVQEIAAVVGLNLVIGFVVPGIDWRAHLGGLVTGAIVGWALIPQRNKAPQWLVPGLAVGAILTAVLMRTAALQGLFY